MFFHNAFCIGNAENHAVRQVDIDDFLNRPCSVLQCQRQGDYGGINVHRGTLLEADH